MNSNYERPDTIAIAIRAIIYVMLIAIALCVVWLVAIGTLPFFMSALLIICLGLIALAESKTTYNSNR